jgi:hypothetical protein
MRTFIRNYAGEYLYDLFREELISDPPIIHNERSEFLWKYINRTIGYSDIFEEIVQRSSMSKGIEQLPQININRYILSNKPEYQGIPPDHYLDLPNRFAIRFSSDPDSIYEVGGVDTIKNIDRVLTGLLILTDEEVYRKIDVEHVNVLTLNPYVTRGLKKTTVDRIEVSRFEPAYGSGGKMSDLDESTEWNRALMMVLKMRLNPLIGKSGDRVSYNNLGMSSFCPLGPQAMEFLQKRKPGEHAGYCQSWSFEFARRLLQYSMIKNGSEVEWPTGFPRLGRVTGFDIDNPIIAVVELQVAGGSDIIVKNVPVSELYLRPASITEIVNSVLDSIYTEVSVLTEDITNPELFQRNRLLLYNFIQTRAREFAELVIDRFYIPHFRQELM